MEYHHNMKDRTPTRGTFDKSGRKSGENWNLKKSYVQVLACMEKLEKYPKKASKRGKKCHHDEGSDSNSDTS